MWWLMDACPGRELAMSFSLERVTRVARAYAQVQHHIGGALVGVCGDAMPRFDAGSLPGWMRSMFDGDLKESLTDAVASAAATWCADVGRACVPASWVALDLDPTNVLVDEDAVRFIDLDDAMFGPAPFGIATFVRRCTSRLRRDPAHGDATGLLDAYSQVWQPRLSFGPSCQSFDGPDCCSDGNRAMQQAWNALSIVPRCRSVLLCRRIDQLTHDNPRRLCVDGVTFVSGEALGPRGPSRPRARSCCCADAARGDDFVEPEASYARGGRRRVDGCDPASRRGISDGDRLPMPGRHGEVPREALP